MCACLAVSCGRVNKLKFDGLFAWLRNIIIVYRRVGNTKTLIIANYDIIIVTQGPTCNSILSLHRERSGKFS